MIPAAVRIFVSTEPCDMRQGFDRLAQRVRASLGEDPQSGSLFVFSNRGASRLKVLWFDSNGFCLLYKRLHRAVFELPPPSGGSAIQIDARRLAELLRGVALRRLGYHVLRLDAEVVERDLPRAIALVREAVRRLAR